MQAKWTVEDLINAVDNIRATDKEKTKLKQQIRAGNPSARFVAYGHMMKQQRRP